MPFLPPGKIGKNHTYGGDTTRHDFFTFPLELIEIRFFLRSLQNMSGISIPHNQTQGEQMKKLYTAVLISLMASFSVPATGMASGDDAQSGEKKQQNEIQHQHKNMHQTGKDSDGSSSGITSLNTSIFSLAVDTSCTGDKDRDRDHDGDSQQDQTKDQDQTCREGAIEVDLSGITIAANGQGRGKGPCDGTGEGDQDRDKDGTC